MGNSCSPLNLFNNAGIRSRVLAPLTAWMRFMSRRSFGHFSVLATLLLAGCGVINPRRDRDAPKGVAKSDLGKGLDKQLALGTGALRESTLADPSTMIPQPPNMNFPEIPNSPGPENALISTPTARANSATDVVIPVRATRAPIERARAVAETAFPLETNPQAVKRLHERAMSRYARLEGFECRVTRRETIGTKAMPEELLQYKLRKEPYSLHIKWIGKEAQGRELVYASGKYENKVQIITGREPELLRPAGIKVARLPTDKDVTSKSRFDIREGGMGLTLDWFSRVVAIMERDPTQSNRLKYVGSKQRLERTTGLEAVEEIIPANWEPLLPKGGNRTTYFDADEGSPSYGLPVLLVTLADTGREVEYYFFDQFQPIRSTDADFDIEKLWKK